MIAAAKSFETKLLPLARVRVQKHCCAPCTTVKYCCCMAGPLYWCFLTRRQLVRVDILYLYCCRAMFSYTAVYMSFHVFTCCNCCYPVLRDATHYSTTLPPAAVVAQELFCGYCVAPAWSARVDALLYSCTKISAAFTYAVVLST